MQGGVWEGKRILSEEWCREATEYRVSVEGTRGYGYSFWKEMVYPTEFHCGGMNGQAIRVYPEKNLVIAWQGHDYNDMIGKFFALADKFGRDA